MVSLYTRVRREEMRRQQSFPAARPTTFYQQYYVVKSVMTKAVLGVVAKKTLKYAVP